MTQTPEAHRPKKGRSPSYPGINLESAIERADALYKQEGRHAAPMSAITGHWGYTSPKTGAAAVTYAALKKFGLLEESGRGDDRMGSLTPLALDIILNPDTSTRLGAIKVAALTPPIHAELWSRYSDHGGLPSDDSLRYELVRNRAFTESGAAEFIRVFRDTLAFAQLQPGATITREDFTPPPPPPGGAAPVTQLAPPLTPPSADGRSLRLPLPGGGTATLETSRPVSDAEWEMIEKVLSTMRTSFIGEPPAPTEPQPDPGALDDDDFEG